MCPLEGATSCPSRHGASVASFWGHDVVLIFLCVKFWHALLTAKYFHSVVCHWICSWLHCPNSTGFVNYLWVRDFEKGILGYAISQSGVCTGNKVRHPMHAHTPPHRHDVFPTVEKLVAFYSRNFVKSDLPVRLLMPPPPPAVSAQQDGPFDYTLTEPPQKPRANAAEPEDYALTLPPKRKQQAMEPHDYTLTEPPQLVQRQPPPALAPRQQKGITTSPTPQQSQSHGSQRAGQRVGGTHGGVTVRGVPAPPPPASVGGSGPSSGTCGTQRGRGC